MEMRKAQQNRQAVGEAEKQTPLQQEGIRKKGSGDGDKGGREKAPKGSSNPNMSNRRIKDGGSATQPHKRKEKPNAGNKA